MIPDLVFNFLGYNRFKSGYIFSFYQYIYNNIIRRAYI